MARRFGRLPTATTARCWTSGSGTPTAPRAPTPSGAGRAAVKVSPPRARTRCSSPPPRPSGASCPAPSSPASGTSSWAQGSSPRRGGLRGHRHLRRRRRGSAGRARPGRPDGRRGGPGRLVRRRLPPPRLPLEPRRAGRPGDGRLRPRRRASTSSRSPSTSRRRTGGSSAPRPAGQPRRAHLARPGGHHLRRPRHRARRDAGRGRLPRRLRGHHARRPPAGHVRRRRPRSASHTRRSSRGDVGAELCRGCEFTLEDQIDFDLVDTYEVVNTEVLLDGDFEPVGPGEGEFAEPVRRDGGGAWEGTSRGLPDHRRRRARTTRRVTTTARPRPRSTPSSCRGRRRSAIDAGHAYVQARGVADSPTLELNAMARRRHRPAMFGDTLVTDTAEVEVTPDRHGQSLRVLRNGNEFNVVPVVADDSPTRSTPTAPPTRARWAPSGASRPSTPSHHHHRQPGVPRRRAAACGRASGAGADRVRGGQRGRGRSGSPRRRGVDAVVRHRRRRRGRPRGGRLRRLPPQRSPLTAATPESDGTPVSGARPFARARRQHHPGCRPHIWIGTQLVMLRRRYR